MNKQQLLPIVNPEVLHDIILRYALNPTQYDNDIRHTGKNLPKDNYNLVVITKIIADKYDKLIHRQIYEPTLGMYFMLNKTLEQLNKESSVNLSLPKVKQHHIGYLVNKYKFDFNGPRYWRDIHRTQDDIKNKDRILENFLELQLRAKKLPIDIENIAREMYAFSYNLLNIAESMSEINVKDRDFSRYQIIARKEFHQAYIN